MRRKLAQCGLSAGHTHPWSVAVDSLLAAQVGDRLTLVSATLDFVF